jgi:hypothetical protein
MGFQGARIRFKMKWPEETYSTEDFIHFPNICNLLKVEASWLHCVIESHLKPLLCRNTMRVYHGSRCGQSRRDIPAAITQTQTQLSLEQAFDMAEHPRTESHALMNVLC